MNFYKPTLENKILFLLLGSLYGALLLMAFASLTIYENHLKDEYQSNLTVVSNTINNMTAEEVREKSFKVCNNSSKKMCKLCTLDNEFVSVNIRYFKTKENIPKEKYSRLLPLKDGSFVQLSIEEGYIETQLSNMKNILLYVFFGVSLIFTFIMIFLYRKLFYPLKCLVRFCHDMTEEKEIIQCPSNSYEIQELRSAILNLLKRNKSLYEKKSDMFKEIAHELKSPIAIMQARLSLLMNNDLTKEEYINETNMDIEDIKRLIYELLFLEEIELDMQNTLKTDISMSGICDIMQKKFQPLLKLNDINIDADWSKDFTIYSFEHSILKVMQAIYENIAIHAKKGSTITMKVDISRKTMHITNLYHQDKDKYFHSTNIGTKIIQRLSDKLNFTVTTEHNNTSYMTAITFHS